MHAQGVQQRTGQIWQTIKLISNRAANIAKNVKTKTKKRDYAANNSGYHMRSK